MEQWNNVTKNTIYGKQVVGAEYKGYFIEIKDEYILKDKNGNIMLKTGLKYEVKEFIDKLIKNSRR